MKKYLLPILLSALSLVAFAQAPDWYDPDVRARFYPVSTYFSGFAMNEMKKGESLDKALESVKAAARVEAVSTIRVHVQSVKKDFSRSDSYSTATGDMEQFYQRFESNTTLSTDMEIPGIKIESYREGNIVAAFAFIKRRDLQRQLEKQITMGLTRLETQMDNIQELINNGQKAEARNRLAALDKEFASVENNQELLLAVDPEADAESLQLPESKKLKQRHAQMTMSLKNGIYIALQCKADFFGTDYPTLQNAIKGELSPLGCTFTDKPEEADWLIVISAKAREYRSDNYGKYNSFFSYVDAHIAITKQATKQKIFEDEISVKGGDTQNHKNAARAAYKDAAPRLSAIIQQQITQ